MNSEPMIVAIAASFGSGLCLSAPGPRTNGRQPFSTQNSNGAFRRLSGMVTKGWLVVSETGCFTAAVVGSGVFVFFELQGSR